MSAITPGMMQNITAGIGAVSSAASGFAQYRRGQAEKAAYEYNADIIMKRMQEERLASQQKFARLKGRQRSLYAKAGVDISSGSPLLVLADTAMQEEIESQRIQTAGEAQSNLQRYYGRVAGFEGTMGGWSTFLTGLGRASTDLYKQKMGVT